MSLVYLVASLPRLVLGEPPPLTSQEFAFRTQNLLGPDERAALAALLAGQPAFGTRFGAAWQARETQLRNALARARAQKRGLEGREFQHEHSGFDAGVAQAVANALAKTNPLEREFELDRFRWTLAEELAWHEPFGLGKVLAFAVQLRLTERWAALEPTVGQRVVEEFVHNQTAAAVTWQASNP
jgi:hypothetical protein